MRGAGQVAIPLGRGVIAPPLHPPLGGLLPGGAFNPAQLGDYGERPLLDEYGDAAAFAAKERAAGGIQTIEMDAGSTTTPAVERPSAEASSLSPANKAADPARPGGVFRELGALIADLLFDRLDSPDTDPLTGGPLRPERSLTDDLYVVNRGLTTANSFTQRTFGRTIDAWVAGEIMAARIAGQTTFRIGVLGTGDGNTERQLLEKIAPLIRGLGMRLEVVAMTLPEHPIAPENLAVMQALTGAGVYLSPQFGDFDVGPLLFENVDILYAIMSTVYSTNPVELTAKIHDALRPPTDGRPGGQAFFMYRSRDEHPATTMASHAFDLLGDGVDVVVARPPEQLSAYAHMTRISGEPIGDFAGRLSALEGRTPVRAYRAARGGPVISLAGNGVSHDALEIFMAGAERLFFANGVGADALSAGVHVRTFGLLRPSVMSGLPLYPDAVGVAYGSRTVLNAIRAHGDDFAEHLPDTSGPSQRDIMEGALFGKPRITF